MVKSFETETVQDMDLYFNDAECLRKSMTGMQASADYFLSSGTDK